jgi:hypothetical protein
LKNTPALVALTLAASLTASADFSYTSSQKITGGTMATLAGTAGDRTNKYYFKGQKMMINRGDTATIIDFGAQTFTTLDNTHKTYTVKKFSDVTTSGVNADVAIDLKDTGQKKVINGLTATEAIMTMSMDIDAGRGGAAMKMQMESDMWISADVPGAGEMRAFYQKNAASFPWAAMMGGGNQSMQKSLVQMQRKLSEINGAVVEQVVRIKSAGGTEMAQMPQMPQMTPAQQAQMQAAMAKMQAMQQQGGPGAAAAQQAMAAMGAMGRGAAAGGSSGSIMEMTMDSSDFSSAPVPDSVFAIPAGYTQK